MDLTLGDINRLIFYLLFMLQDQRSVAGKCLTSNHLPNYDVELDDVKWDRKRLYQDNFNFASMSDNITLGIYQSREGITTLYKGYCHNLSTSSVQDLDTKLNGFCYRSLRSIMTRGRSGNQSHLFLSLLDNGLKRFHMFSYDCNSRRNQTDIEPFNVLYSYEAYERINKRIEVLCKVLKTYDRYERRNNNERYICFGFWIYTSSFARIIRYFISVNLFVSLICLFVTSVVYIILPDLRRNTYGKCIVLYLLSYMLSISVNLVRHSFHDEVKDVCHHLSFLMQFAALNRLSWQSVMCFDILQAFSRMKNPRDAHGGSDKYKILWYSIYAYGFPGIITVMTAVLQYSSILSDDNPWKPQLRLEKCYFQINYQRERKYQWLYFYSFYCGQFFVNCVMFVATSVLLLRHSKAAKSYAGSFRRNISSKQEKSMVLVHIKLFFLMGCNWILAIMTVIMGEFETQRSSSRNWMMHFADYFTSVMPQFFFLILVCTAETTRKLRARYIELCARNDIQTIADEDQGTGSRSTVTTLM